MVIANTYIVFCLLDTLLSTLHVRTKEKERKSGLLCGSTHLKHIRLKSQVSLDLLGMFIVPKEATSLANQSSKEVGAARTVCPP